MISVFAFFRLAIESARSQGAGPIRVPLGAGLTIEILDGPGNWISDEGLRGLTEELRSVYSRAMGGKVPEYGVLLGEREDMRRRLIAIIRDTEGLAIAFSAQARLHVEFGNVSEEVIHLGLVAVDSTRRRGGLQGVLYSLPFVYIFFTGGLNRVYFTNVTQVPAIIGQCEDYLQDVFPSSRPGAKQGFHHYRIATTVYEKFKQVYGVGEDSRLNAYEQVIENSYTGGSDELKKTFDQCAKHRRESVNAFCESKLDYVRGDDFIQVGRMDYQAAFSFQYAHAEGHPVRKFMNRMAVGLLHSVVVPSLSWLLQG